MYIIAIIFATIVKVNIDYIQHFELHIVHQEKVYLMIAFTIDRLTVVTEIVEIIAVTRLPLTGHHIGTQPMYNRQIKFTVFHLLLIYLFNLYIICLAFTNISLLIRLGILNNKILGYNQHT